MKCDHTNHEDIIEAVRSAWNWWQLDNFTENSWFAIESFVAKYLQPGLQVQTLRADGYFGLDDGFPCMFLEVGRMKDGKWSHIYYDNDDQPARVLRVGFDRHAYLLHPRNTERERDFLTFLNTFLVKESHHERQLAS